MLHSQSDGEVNRSTRCLSLGIFSPGRRQKESSWVQTEAEYKLGRCRTGEERRVEEGQDTGKRHALLSFGVPISKERKREEPIQTSDGSLKHSACENAVQGAQSNLTPTRLYSP
jgi:hypothetical protein